MEITKSFILVCFSWVLFASEIRGQNARFFGSVIPESVKNFSDKIPNPANFIGSSDNSSSTYTGAIVDKIIETVEDFDASIKAIYPGTKWCGAGDKAKEFTDLGMLEGTDRCCREHDYCPENIPAGESKYGLDNNSAFTRSECQCDLDFYNCLKNDNTIISKKIGGIYFNLLRLICYKYDYPAECAETSGIIRKRCDKYDYNRRESKKWQFFENPAF